MHAQSLEFDAALASRPGLLNDALTQFMRLRIRALHERQVLPHEQGVRALGVAACQ